MIKTQSKQILAFYQAYKQWLDAGAPGYTEALPFYRGTGLCANLTYWFHRKSDPVGLVNTRVEMEKQFKAFELDPYFPFHYEQSHRYYFETAHNTCHLNEHRIEWVKMMLEVPCIES